VEGETPLKIQTYGIFLRLADISLVPYGEANAWVKGFHSPYYS